MKINTKNPTTVSSGWTRFLGAMLTLALMVPAAAVSQPYANPLPVPLGWAGTYGALASAGIPGSANVQGDIGTTTGTIDPTIKHTGTNWNDAIPSHNVTAQADLGIALANASGRTNDAMIPANLLGDLTLGCGVYDGTALILASGKTLTLNGSATDVFIIRSTSSLGINGGTVSLTGGAVWSNVFWYVGSAATILSGSTFNGIILAQTSITLNASAIQVTAQLLAHNGAATINSDVALPLQLVTFTAQVMAHSVQLDWMTISETNNYGFYVQRRAGDGKTFTTVSELIPGAGTSLEEHNYQWTDTSVSAGEYVYRLQQIDLDGSFSYSHEIHVDAVLGVKPEPAPQVFRLEQNYPNPFNPSTRIEYSLEKTGMVSLKVYNVLGIEVATLVNGRQEAGSYIVQLGAKATSGLSSGVYFCRLEAGSFVSTKKLILMK